MYSVRLMVYAYSLVYFSARAEVVTRMSTQSFFLPYNTRGIPNGLLPAIMKERPANRTNPGTPRTSLGGLHSQPSELEARLLRVFESAGIDIPSWPQNLACMSGLLMLFDSSYSRGGAAYIPMLENHIQALRSIAERETARRVEAEASLAEKEAHHTRILLDIEKECREPFVVPALLDAFVALSETVDNVVSGMNS